MSERFPSDWLALREPVDHRSRAHDLTDELAGWLAGRQPKTSALTVVDLAAGAGSNLRYLAPRLPTGQRWTLIDHDAELLARARAGAPEDVPTTSVERSLAVEGADALAGAISPEPPARPDLVTASALFDLVSERWLRDLVAAVGRSESAVLFTLSYDGRITWSDPDPVDVLVRDAVNAHQRGDKGFGPALGPSAGAAIATAFGDAGFDVRSASTPWRLGPGDEELTSRLVEGWTAAAADQEPAATDELSAWRERRYARIAAGAFGIEVGHTDVLALPRS